MTLWRLRAPAWRVGLGAVAVAGGVAMLTTGLHRDSLYAQAGRDVLATMHALDRLHPDPAGPIAIGPEPLLEGNVAGLLDASVTSAALQAHRGDPNVAAYVTLDAADFWRVPAGLRFDHRSIRRP